MTNNIIDDDNIDNELVLAAEDCPKDSFAKYHYFSAHEQSIITRLKAHGPVLLRGGRGSGKSALFIETYNRIINVEHILAIYKSLRNISLIRSEGKQYEELLCRIIIDSVKERLNELGLSYDFHSDAEAASLQKSLVYLCSVINRRIVILLDDVAHIGREQPLEEFFDIFRTLSSDYVSLKATIYPGVTNFGKRFDVYNDATVIDIIRDERSQSFGEFFIEVIKRRYSKLLTKITPRSGLTEANIASFLGRSVVGNMRALIKACSFLADKEKLGLTELGECLIYLAENYYWPLLDEVAPKLGKFKPLIKPCKNLASEIFKRVSSSKEDPNEEGSTALYKDSVIIHRDLVQKYLKLLEILEYTGFISRREVSRAMKSGGRGTRYSVNLCNLIEELKGARLTQAIFDNWLEKNDPVEIWTRTSSFEIEIPELNEKEELEILTLGIEKLEKSNAYPYGLTDKMITKLQEAGYTKILDLSEASEEDLRKIFKIGPKIAERIKNTVEQAIWM
ncbi:helix-hairpin-helix domain-containing protein [Candidatus Magnetominusculus xianensis]|uniref:Uncharacterized protein n=1 Tax=Candidatus Magnetominusculus xianensis TaxID=1748249 RepID=A0ABR5SNT4_9BACT|nr:helix-hairpin-helix domain-containing protein [Candidatus Magnetominusculus xianensis]KWT95164.1 hypothetical protein ASN18_0093 [Candidatus Magnetominusculus xianensis]MBF0402811.1 helix-hairpin-helix domain-containing protein [Nitrospirota bacterium]